MKKEVWGGFLALGFVVMLNLSSAYAQTPAATEEDKFSFGKVVAVSNNIITVKEYDFAKDADVEAGYSVTAETEFGNINAVTDLKAGDDIVLDYVEKEGNRVVTTLVKEEAGAEATPGEVDTAAPEGAEVMESAPVEPAQK